MRDQVAFGYDRQDAKPTPAVLADSSDQCNMKTLVRMALLRAVGMSCRLHDRTIHKRLERGVVPEVAYRIGRGGIPHS